MGLYEKFLGHIMIPGLTFLLCLMCFVPARRQLQKVAIQIAELKINVNGFYIYILPFVAVTNVVFFWFKLQEMYRLQRLDEKHQDEPGEHARFLQSYYKCSRDAVLNVCSALMIMQFYLAGKRYESYTKVKDEAEAIKAREKAAAN